MRRGLEAVPVPKSDPEADVEAEEGAGITLRTCVEKRLGLDEGWEELVEVDDVFSAALLPELERRSRGRRVLHAIME